MFIVGIADVPYSILEPTHNKQSFAEEKRDDQADARKDGIPRAVRGGPEARGHHRRRQHERLLGAVRLQQPAGQSARSAKKIA